MALPLFFSCLFSRPWSRIYWKWCLLKAATILTITRSTDRVQTSNNAQQSPKIKIPGSTSLSSSSWKCKEFSLVPEFCWNAASQPCFWILQLLTENAGEYVNDATQVADQQRRVTIRASFSDYFASVNLKPTCVAKWNVLAGVRCVHGQTSVHPGVPALWPLGLLCADWLSLPFLVKALMLGDEYCNNTTLGRRTPNCPFVKFPFLLRDHYRQKNLAILKSKMSKCVQSKLSVADLKCASLLSVRKSTVPLFFFALLFPVISHLLPCVYRLMSASARSAPFSLLFSLSLKCFLSIPLSVP